MKEELRFAGSSGALQYLADVTGKRVRVSAEEADMRVVRPMVLIGVTEDQYGNPVFDWESDDPLETALVELTLSDDERIDEQGRYFFQGEASSLNENLANLDIKELFSYPQDREFFVNDLELNECLPHAVGKPKKLAEDRYVVEVGLLPRGRPESEVLK